MVRNKADRLTVLNIALPARALLEIFSFQISTLLRFHHPRAINASQCLTTAPAGDQAMYVYCNTIAISLIR